MSQKPTLQKVQSRRKAAEPRPPGLPHAASTVAPATGASKNFVQAGRSKTLAERGSRAAIISQIGGDALAHEISLLEGENFNPETYVTTKCQTMTEAVSPLPSPCKQGLLTRLLQSQSSCCWLLGLFEIHRCFEASQ